ncbi:MAG: capsular biosynthesis protein [Hyphomicrobiales bacterium]|nr:capsular biosynthesis protein [Hyphomicrobiales bacterium]
MIDLHSHILPFMDDGSASIDDSISMAKLAVADGITFMACTPHVIPGMYDNDTQEIRFAIRNLQRTLYDQGIALELALGADVHIAPDLPVTLGTEFIPTLNGTRYFLFEPTHHVLPPRLEELSARLLNVGFIPIITHPERLSWIVQHYHIIERLNEMGCLMQITAGSVTGAFGKTVRYYTERLLDEGRVDIIASDAHNTNSRPPILSKARDIVAGRLGIEAATSMVLGRPAQILANRTVVARGLGVKANKSAHASTKKNGLGSLLNNWMRGDKS